MEGITVLNASNRLSKKRSHKGDYSYLTLWKPDYLKTFKKYVCFTNALRMVGKCDKLDFRIPKRSRIKTYLNSNVIITDEQAAEWINTIQTHYGGIYDVKITKTNIFYSLNTRETKSKFHLFILTHMRYLYEQPYSDILHDAFIMRDKYPEHSLYQWVLWVHFIYRFGTGHSLMFTTWENGRNLNDLKKLDINTIKSSKQYGVTNKFKELESLPEKEAEKIVKKLKKELYD